MPLVRLLLGIVFVLVGTFWAVSIYRAYRRDHRRGGMDVALDFVSGSAIDFVLIVALLFFGALLIVGYR